MEHNLKRIIIGTFAWIGGDSAKFTINDLSKITLLKKKNLKQMCDQLCKESLIIQHNNHYEVSKGGSKLINHSILYSIFQWSYLAKYVDLINYDTIQSYFLSGYRNLDIVNIRSDYILNYCNTLITILNDVDDSFKNMGYARLRNYVIRLSMFPTKEYVVGNNKLLIESLYSQLKNDVISLSIMEPYGLFIKFNMKKLRDSIGRYKKTN